ncbi:hypothetical protein MKX01_000150 [Papaver californicum]|nr:hypothetical protein MKX01_000150 [Papaver californicum]
MLYVTFTNNGGHKLQLALLEGIQDENKLFAAGYLFSKKDYEDDVTQSSNLCGYPLCKNSLPLERPRKGRYRISLKQHKCVVNSLAFGGSLQDDRCPVMNPSKVNEVLKGFGLSELRIQEIMDAKALGDWVGGPSNAIEGYFPEKGNKLNAESAKPKKGKGKVVNEMEFTSSIIMGDQLASSETMLEESKVELNNSTVKSQVEIPQVSYSVSKNGSDMNVTDLEGELRAGIEALLQETALKSLGSKKLTRTVTWADEKENGNGNDSHDNLCNVQEMGDRQGGALSSSSQIVEDSSARLTSAEACAIALQQAAEVVACDSEMVENALEPESAPLKWPTKPGVFNFELFDSENSWFEPPHEGFSLSLLHFATMYMALFGWFLSVKGRSYPYKIVLSDRRSSEVKHTMSGCLTRALPGLVMDLRLPTPTMSFIDALPSFRMKQWYLVVLLFMDALSVCQIPGLSAHMTGTRMLTHKFLDGAQTSSEEYELLKDHVVSLGRLSQFSTQSGG